jgi:hypothetical protein
MDEVIEQYGETVLWVVLGIVFIPMALFILKILSTF